MTMTLTNPKDKLITADELLRLRGKDIRGELIGGRFCPTEPNGAAHGEAVMNLGGKLGAFVKARRLGTLAAGSGIWLERGPDTVRKADISFFSTAKVSRATRVPGYAEVAPDLAVEVMSFHETLREISDKARMWISYGVPLVWAVYPDTRSVDVHAPGGATRTLSENDALDGGGVLPGFSCRVDDIFEF